MTDEIQKLVDGFTAAYNLATTIRLELDAVVNSIDTAEDNYKNTEKAVNQGTAYADELDNIAEYIKGLKTTRDEISKRLKSATSSLAKAETDTISPIGNELLRLFGDVQKSERELYRAADTLRDFAESLPKRRWIWYRELSPLKRTVICSNGLRELIINNGDKLYFERLRKDIENYE